MSSTTGAAAATGATSDNNCNVLTLTSEQIEETTRIWNETCPDVKLKSDASSEVRLPIKGEKNIYITSALPYVNNVPHLGNIIGCVLSGDVFARYCRLRGLNTLYISGTDEYGTATETKALEEKLTPQQICDKYNKLHCEIYDWFNISFDYFGRTTTKQQTLVGQDIFLRLWNNGYLKEDTVQQLFCTPCNRFLSDRFVEGTCPNCQYEDARGDQCDKCGRLTNSIELRNPRCKICASKDVITKTSQHIFLDLPKLEELEGVSEWVEETSKAWSSNARGIAKSWIKEGLKERCITRDLSWGTPVPLEKFKEKVFYVWFDAPIGYISITACYTNEWKQWWYQNPEVDIDYYQFMAKDNVAFHSILFPSSLKGTKEPWTLVKHIYSTEYLNYEEGKFSKSRGVGVFGNDAKDTGIPSDIWRFYLIYLRPESQDSAFSWDDFMTKNNSELLNNLGNFVNRSLTFIEKFFESQVPEMNLNSDDINVIAQINLEIAEYITLLDNCKLRDALKKVLSISKIGNQYFQSQQPWTLNKNESDKPRCSTICGLGAQIVYLLTTLLDPFMPATGKQIREQMNVEYSVFSAYLRPFLTKGHTIGKIVPLFKKLEQPFMEGLRKKYAGQQQSSDKPQENGKTPSIPSTPIEPASPEEIKKFEELVAEQGNRVRDLKLAKAAKAEIDVEVTKLLELKKELNLKSGIVPEVKAGGGKGKVKAKTPK